MDVSEAAAAAQGPASAAAASHPAAGSTVEQLLANPLLTDLPKNVTLEEVEALIALESGSGMQLTIRKLNGSSFNVSVHAHTDAQSQTQGTRPVKASLLLFRGSMLLVAFIVVTQTARLRDIKQAIRRHYERQEQQHMGKRHISWKYVWRKNCMTFDSKRLLQDDERVHDCGVRNNSELAFARLQVTKQRGRHTKARRW